MTITINQRTFVGMSNLVLQRQSDNVIMAWPTPQNFVLNTNIEQRIQEGRSNQGRKVRTGSYVAGEMPDLSIQYSYIQPEMIGFQIGNQMATGTFGTFAPKSLVVTKPSYPAAAEGYLFEGGAADPETARASVVRDGLSTPLTRMPFAAFDGTSPANDDSYAVGADGALMFSDNLVANRDVVMILLPVNVAGIKLSDILIGPHSLYATLVNTENKLTFFEAYSVTPNLEGRSVDFGGEGGMELGLFLNNPPGECRAFQIVDSQILVGCS